MTDLISYIAPFISNILKYFLLAGIPFLIFYVFYPNVFSKNKIQAKKADKKDFIREIKHSMQSTFISVGVVLLILKTPLISYTQFYKDLADYPTWWIPLSALLALIIHDTYFYWMHKTVHHPTLYKRVHLIHHKSVSPSPWTSFSFHFFEAILEAMVAPLILLLIPMSIPSLIIFGFVSFIFNVYGHLGYEIAPKWFRHSFLFEILNTSTHHNIHHAKFKGNYGLYFRVWDRIMGTEHPDYVKEYDRIQEQRFGQNIMSFNKLKSTISIILLVSMAFLTISASTAPDKIEGEWKFRDNGAIVQIYEKNGMYFGRLIDAGNKEENQNLKEHGELILMRNFTKKGPNTYCCGTLLAPKKKITLSAIITLEKPNKLRVDAKYNGISGSRILDKI